MRARWLRVTAVAALAAGCGEGRAIFDVDVYSLLRGTGADTVSYFIAPGPPADAYTVRKISLPGAGSSIVDQAHVTGTAEFVNTSGSGKLSLQLYLAEDSIGTYAPGALALQIDSTTITGPGTFPVGFDTDLAAAIQVLTKSEVWVRLVGGGSNTGVTLLAGDLVFQSLTIRVVIADKFF